MEIDFDGLASGAIGEQVDPLFGLNGSTEAKEANQSKKKKRINKPTEKSASNKGKHEERQKGQTKNSKKARNSITDISRVNKTKTKQKTRYQSKGEKRASNATAINRSKGRLSQMHNKKLVESRLGVKIIEALVTESRALECLINATVALSLSLTDVRKSDKETEKNPASLPSDL